MFLETDLFLAIRDTRKMDRCVNPQRPPLGNSDQFNEHWESILNDLSVTVRAVQIGDELAGCISCFKCDGQDSIGYWIGRDFWGRRIATQALSLLLGEVSIRPLHARVAVSNPVSIRVLQKCGFEIVDYQHSPADDRYQECEETILELT
jgi:RimJ/RimL family protein N-acetyltransferase